MLRATTIVIAKLEKQLLRAKEKCLILLSQYWKNQHFDSEPIFFCILGAPIVFLSTSKKIVKFYFIWNNLTIFFSLMFNVAYWIKKLFQYCDNTIGLFSIAPNIVIAILTIKKSFNLSVSLFVFGLYTDSFLYCSFHSYSNSCRSFLPLKTITKSNGKHIAIAFKSEKSNSEKFTFSLCYHL